MFKTTNLSKKSKSKIILSHLNFSLDYGQIGIFLGGSGAGKSTLLRILNHLETFDEGSFHLDETPIHHKDNTIGMVFQQFNLFEHLNTEENILITLANKKKTTKKEALVRTKELLQKYELEQQAKTPASCLSGGQKQRLAIARALCQDPKIICFDEPTSALDPRLSSQIAKCIQELGSSGKIVLVTTHDMNLLKQLQAHIFLLENGQIVERAHTENYENHPKLQKFIQGL